MMILYIFLQIIKYIINYYKINIRCSFILDDKMIFLFKLV